MVTKSHSFAFALAFLMLVNDRGLSQSPSGGPNQSPIQSPIQPPSQQYQTAIESAVESISGSLIRFETIGGLERVDGEIIQTGPSTGLVVTADGYAISAAINFAHQPTAIFARTMDGEKLMATIVAHDFSRNLVLLKLDSSHEFPIPPTVSRKQLSVGQTVIAVGRASDRSTPNLSTGIISATHRIWGKAIQTDAKISAVNFGGPLLDLKGWVAGILVPLSPDTDDVTGGSEWYDSGIGFAVPLDEVLMRIDELKAGKNLRSGLLGVTLEGSDIYADPAVVAYCPGSTPAWESGLRAGDQIVAINDQPILRTAQLKHAIGPLMENDIVTVDIMRDEKQLDFKFKLIGELDPYQPTAIGILATDHADPTGVGVRYVFPEAQSNQIGIEPGDLIVAADGKKIAIQSDLRKIIALKNKGEILPIKAIRDGETISLDVQIQNQNADLPIELSAGPEKTCRPEDLKIEPVIVSDASNKCFALIPPKSNESPTVMVWVPEPGQIEAEKFLQPWRIPAAEKNLILLVPQSSESDRWHPDEVEFVTKALANLLKKHSIESPRICVGGQGAGGALASLIVESRRDLFRGLIMLDAGFAQRVELKTSPVQPLLVFAGATTVFQPTKKFEKLVERLTNLNLPHLIDTKTSAESPGWIETITSWAITIDRL